MKYVLDTDTLIYFLKGQENIVKRITQIPLSAINTTVINQAELLFGAYNSDHKKHNLEIVNGLLSKIAILPFSEAAVYVFAEQKASLKKRGKLIADMDLMISSVCLANKMTLVTNNIKHFDRIKNLSIENWTA